MQEQRSSLQLRVVQFADKLHVAPGLSPFSFVLGEVSKLVYPLPW